MKDIEQIQENISDYVSSYMKHVLKDLAFYQKDEGYKFQAVATFQKEFNVKGGPEGQVSTINKLGMGTLGSKLHYSLCLIKIRGGVHEITKILKGI